MWVCVSPGLSSRLIITSVTWPTLHGIIEPGLWPSSKLLFGDKSILQSGQTAIWLTVIVQCPWSPLTISDRCPSASDRLIIRETSPGLHTPQPVPFRKYNTQSLHWVIQYICRWYLWLFPNTVRNVNNVSINISSILSIKRSILIVQFKDLSHQSVESYIL